MKPAEHDIENFFFRFAVYFIEKRIIETWSLIGLRSAHSKNQRG
jgi:hypothetical protein